MKIIPYHKQLDLTIQQIQIQMQNDTAFKKPRLLLHACCGPCSSYVIEYLSGYFEITIYYYNPNIHPSEEYYRRLSELKNFLARFPDALKNSVKLVEEVYNPEEYFSAVKTLEQPELQFEAERGERCRRCYEFRMKKAFEYANNHFFDWFTTTLSISPHKDAEKINIIGENLQKELEEPEKTLESQAFTKYLPADFKKRGGFLRSTQLSKEYGLWRQDYCGCVYSRKNLESKKERE